MHKLERVWLGLHQPHRIANIERLLSFFLCFVFFTGQAAAVIRFQDRSLEINSSRPGDVATYKVSFGFTSQVPVGSVDMKFCIDPIPYMACDAPAGLDVSHAVLADQTGEAGFSISTQTPNHIVLSRASPAVVGNEQSTYVFTGIINPTYKIHSFAIRLSDYASTNATGTPIDVGSIVNMINEDVTLETQVPPMLIFCLAQKVELNCNGMEGGNYSDLGDLSPSTTLKAESQMAVGTNASGGFVITATGTSLAAGTHEISPLATPTVSKPGTNQFGINLVENTSPEVGHDPDGDFSNAIADVTYDQPNKFAFRSGDIVASAPNVSLIRRFTTSYIVNISPTLPAGVYTTTITYVCTGRF
jgi:hypothetical protein